jgi:hypothetical protein
LKEYNQMARRIDIPLNLENSLSPYDGGDIEFMTPMSQDRVSL